MQSAAHRLDPDYVGVSTRVLREAGEDASLSCALRCLPSRAQPLVLGLLVERSGSDRFRGIGSGDIVPYVMLPLSNLFAQRSVCEHGLVRAHRVLLPCPAAAPSYEASGHVDQVRDDASTTVCDSTKSVKTALLGHTEELMTVGQRLAGTRRFTRRCSQQVATMLCVVRYIA